MSNPAYLWLTDQNDSPISGGCRVLGREGAIEIKHLTHNMNIPADGNTGTLTGTRVHSPIILQKEFDRTTPMLYRAISEGTVLKSAMIKMYTILESGLDAEYFNIILDNVKIVSITPALYPGNQTGLHSESLHLRYEAITWKYVDGNIIYKDSWNARAIA